MSATIIINIAQLVNVRQQSSLLKGKALAELPVIENAFLLIEDGIIADYGAMYELELKVPQLPKYIIDAQDQFVLPAWCDSHTHLVFAATREEEFFDKIKGLSYAEIAAKGATTFNTVIKTVNVRETPLAVVLDNNLPAKQTIDFLSLDVAGFDMRALKSIDWNRYIPVFIVVKINAGQQRGVASICSFLMRRNYEQVVQTNHGFLFKYNRK